MSSASQAERTGAEQISAKFFVSLSRKLRQDLRALHGYLEELREQIDNPRLLDLVNASRISTQHMSITLNSATDYARATGGKFTPKNARFNLHQLIHEVVSVVAVDARQRDIAILQQLEPDMPQRLRGDRVMVGECLAHVLHNAVTFGRTTVRFSVQYADGELIALIEDDGPGIPEEQAERACQPFETLQKSDRYPEGPGLGLAVTRAFTEVLGGELLILRGADEMSGTIVELRWPLEAASPFTTGDPLGTERHLKVDSVPELDWLPPSERQYPKKPTSDTRSFHNVMVVDDDPHLLDVVTTVLNGLGVPYECAKDGEEGLQKLRAGKFTAAIIDMQMPVLNGFSLIREIRRDPVLCTIKILALTTLRLRQEKEACFDAGCDLYQAKPVSFEGLTHRVTELLSLTKNGFQAEEPPHADVIAQNIALLQERYASSFPELMDQLSRQLDETLAGNSEAMDGLRATLHRISGTSGSLYFDALSQTSMAAHTTVRALQRAYPDPEQLPAESRRALKSATRRVKEQLAAATARSPDSRSA